MPQKVLDIRLQSIGIGIELLATNSSDTRTTPNKRIYQKSKYGRANPIWEYYDFNILHLQLRIINVVFFK